MANTLHEVFRSIVQEDIYSFDIILVNEELQGILVGFSLVNLHTGKVFLSLSTKIELSQEGRIQFSNEIFNTAKLIKENIFS